MVIINDKSFPAEYLEKPDDLQKGMMGRDSLEGCMVFKMGMGTHSFWMKKCLIPLDIVFVNKGRISNIHRDCQPCDMDCNQRYSGIGDHVIEFQSGTSNGWKIGDKVKMYLGTPQNPVR